MTTALASAADTPAAVTCARVPQAWAEFVMDDTDPVRLRAVLTDLESVPQDGILIARRAHVLMLLGEPRRAVDLLRPELHRLCHAMRQLALCQVAREEINLSQYLRIIEVDPHYGMALGLTELEAQVRLDYALGIAHGELGRMDLRMLHYGRAQHVAQMAGMHHMIRVIDAAISWRDSQRDPLTYAHRLKLMVHEAEASNNRKLVSHLAVSSRDLLAEANAYEQIPELAAEWGNTVPEAQTWTLAARVFSDPNLVPPALGEAPDSLVLAATCYHLLTRAARAREQMDVPSSQAAAARVLGLPGWPGGGEVTMPEAVYRAMRIAAYLYAGRLQQATVALREAVLERLHIQSDTAAWYFGGLYVEMLSRGSAYLPEWTPSEAVPATLAALSRVDHALGLTIVTRLANVLPTAAVILSRSPQSPSVLADVVLAHIAVVGQRARDAGEPTPRLTLAGVQVKGYLRTAHALDVLREVDQTGLSAHPQRAVNIHRHAKALQAAGSPPFAFPWQVERGIEELSRCGHDLTLRAPAK